MKKGSATTKISQSISTLNDAAQVLNRSLDGKAKDENDKRERRVNVISPVVIAKSHRSWFWVILTIIAIVLGAGGAAALSFVPNEIGSIIFGWHFWLPAACLRDFQTYGRNSYVEIPDGCQALITRFGKVVKTVEAGRTYILNPWNKVGYIVNTVKEYPYNAPIREAPTLDQVNASVDLFLQFRINATAPIYL